MKYSLSTTGGIHQFTLDAIPKGISLGVTPLDDKPPYPSLVLEYDLKTLNHLSPLFSRMREQELEPEIYLWDLQAPEPELRVDFVIPVQERKTFIRLAGSLMAPVITGLSDEADSFEFRAISAGNAEPEWVEKFLGAFREKGVGVVFVTEQGTKEGDRVRPVFTFVVTSVATKQPPPVIG